MMVFLLRFLGALALVIATYNPTRWNFVAWAGRNLSDNLPMVALVAVVLVIGYVVYLTATWRSIGILGVVLVLGLVAAIDWVLIDFGILAADNPTVMTWIGLVTIALVMGIGMTWSIIWRRLSGQLEVDDDGG